MYLIVVMDNQANINDFLKFFNLYSQLFID